MNTGHKSYKKKKKGKFPFRGGHVCRSLNYSAGPDTARGRCHLRQVRPAGLESLWGTRSAARIRVSLRRAARSPACSRAGAGASPQAGRGGEAAGGRSGGGWDAFTWRRGDPGASGSTRAWTAPTRSRGSSGDSARGSRCAQQGMLRSSHRPSWCVVRKFLLPSQKPKVGGGRRGEGTFRPGNPDLLPSSGGRGPPSGPGARGEPLPAAAPAPGDRAEPGKEPSTPAPPPHSPTRAPEAKGTGRGRGRGREPHGGPRVCSCTCRLPRARQCAYTQDESQTTKMYIQ